ncbi:MAG: AmmeMemoRadiSam system protein B, partial [Treponema sp.]|nr:AmmeMemoRadiSam system protein B [Treponema sp.]
MNLREPCLPRGWYPRDTGKIEEFLEPFLVRDKIPAKARAVVAPHAGWYYSGLPAALAVSALDREAETVAVIGGHLAADMPVLIAGEDGVQTPFGVMNMDSELRDAFKKGLPADASRPDRYPDNTVEVLLPMV